MSHAFLHIVVQPAAGQLCCIWEERYGKKVPEFAGLSVEVKETKMTRKILIALSPLFVIAVGFTTALFFQA
jgi:hypothetical protein